VEGGACRLKEKILLAISKMRKHNNTLPRGGDRRRNGNCRGPERLYKGQNGRFSEQARLEGISHRLTFLF